MQGKEQVPQRYDAARESWRKLHPNWVIKTWDEQELATLVKGTAWQDILVRTSSMIERADIYRCAILHKEGGVYADMDAYAIESFDVLLSNADVSKVHLGKTSFRPGFPVSNCILFCAPTLPFWEKHFIPAVKLQQSTSTWLDEMSPVLSVMRTTGPGLWSKLVSSKQATQFLKLHPARFFYATDIPKKRLLTDEDKLELRGCYAYHMQDTQWLQSWELLFLLAFQKPVIPLTILCVAILSFLGLQKVRTNG